MYDALVPPVDHRPLERMEVLVVASAVVSKVIEDMIGVGKG